MLDSSKSHIRESDELNRIHISIKRDINSSLDNINYDKNKTKSWRKLKKPKFKLWIKKKYLTRKETNPASVSSEIQDKNAINKVRTIYKFLE